jgi:predicted Kef-type K+ transport protein
MELLWLALAFFSGLSVKIIGLPPLVGYLLAGFILSAFGIGLTENSTLEQLSDLGITLMLFTIGLKLHFKDLLKKEVLIGGTIHMLLWTLLTVAFISLITFLLPHISNVSLSQALLLGFILSFSSTICALKILQESTNLESRHGKLCISILVLQDVFAVVFLVFSAGYIPSIWALALPLLLLLKPILNRLLNHVGHGELLFIMGVVLALAGYELFEAINLKGDLGALLIGMLLSGHAKHNELVKSLTNFKDLLLIGFFLSIGLLGVPDFSALSIALVLSLLLTLKFILFYALFALLKLRARTSYLTSILLSNYGEFGLIVAYIGVSLGLLSEQWLVILALTVAISLIITSICYTKAHDWYNLLRPILKKYQHNEPLEEDCRNYPQNIDILIVGTGRIGSSALERLNKLNTPNVWGIDSCVERVAKLQEKKFNVFLADAEDRDFWHDITNQKIQLVLLALPSTEESLKIVSQLKQINYTGKIIAVAQYEDERQKLRNSGVDEVYNIFKEAGAKFAEDSLDFANSNN